VANEALIGRVCKVTLSVPVDTPGDFSNVLTTNVIEIGGANDPKQPGLRIQFKVEKSTDKHPNSSELIITNLNKDSRSGLQKKGVKVIIEAGYQSTGVSRIFAGDVRTVDHIRGEATWDTTMKLGDGERSWKFARVNESFAPGTGAGTILKFLANKTGLQIGNVPTEVANLTQSFDHGYTVHGPVWRSLSELARSVGYTVSIQAGTVQILRPGATLGNGSTSEVPEITPDTGLIGSPEMGTPEKKGKPQLVKFRSLMRPSTPGAVVKLRSDRYDGFLRVKKCSFDGDTAGGPYYTDYEGVIIGAT